MILDFKLSDEDLDKIRQAIHEELQSIEILREGQREENAVKEVLTIQEAAELLSWSRGKILTEMKKDMPNHKIEGRIMLLKSELIDWIKSKKGIKE